MSMLVQKHRLTLVVTRKCVTIVHCTKHRLSTPCFIEECSLLQRRTQDSLLKSTCCSHYASPRIRYLISKHSSRRLLWGKGCYHKPILKNKYEEPSAHQSRVDFSESYPTPSCEPRRSSSGEISEGNRRLKRGKHVCMADHDPLRLNHESDHCLRCKGTFQKLTEVSEINVTLAGCGFLGTYYLGVYEVLKRNGSDVFRKIRRWGGASAGAISAALITCYPDDPWIGMTVAQNIVKSASKNILGVLSPRFSLSDVLHSQLDEHLPDDAHELANGNLYISVTECSNFKNEIITDFASREELIEAVLCSCHIPLYSGFSPPEYKGKKYMDGGLTHNLPVYPYSGSTIFVSPFSGCQHICPRDESPLGFSVDLSGHRFRLNGPNVRRGLHGFLNPSDETFMKYYEFGVTDTTEFLKRNECFKESATALDS